MSISELLPPDHVSPDLVRDFDIYDLPNAEKDVHAAYAAIQAQWPPIFWTPRNGGHWVLTRGEDILAVLRDPSHFSSHSTIIPPMPGERRQIPLEIDPPDHGRYRRPLAAFLSPSLVNQMDGEMRQVARAAIGALKPSGGCEFMNDFARVLPVHIFLRLVDLPLTDKDRLLAMLDDCVRASTSKVRQ
ncbi:MAG: cytochrome P450, partial [Burkholderiales bacterium]